MIPPDPASLNLKVGFEIHQQLATKNKLFCNCSCEEAHTYDDMFMRKLRPTQSELGAYDPAAMFEFSKMRTVEYYSAVGHSCLVEADEEPPHDVNCDALETALIFSLALNSRVMDEIHVMRKMVIDGSNTTGFQRTMLVASGGYLDVAGKRVNVQSICLEEDAAKLIEDNKQARKYGLDRLGIPLVEIALEPVTGKPEEIMQVALTLGRLLRASRRVARGLGSIRQDVNISLQNGAVVEVKGVQQLDQLVKVIKHEIQRQHGLIVVAEKLKQTKVNVDKVGDKVEDVTDILSKAQSKIIKRILDSSGSKFKAIRAPGFAGMIGFEPYEEIRLGREIGKLVRFYDLEGIFHSDELPNYGITKKEVCEIKDRLQMNDSDAFVIVGGPKDKVELASVAITNRLKAAISGVPAETRAALPDGKTVFLRPRPGAARMYPETDIPTIPVTKPLLTSFGDKVPKPWDEVLKSIMKKYGLNEKLAKEIFDSDYLNVFEQVVGETNVQPTFIASKLTEDITSLIRQGVDASALADDMIKDIFSRLDKGAIAKESVSLIFEKLMKNQAKNVDEAIKAAGIFALSDEELNAIIDKVITENMAALKEKGMNAQGMLMGRVMAVARGKADGQKINAVLNEKIQKFIK